MKCVYCGESRAAIRREKLICGSVDSETGELYDEMPRHRFKPWTPEELKEQEEAAQKEFEYWDGVGREMDQAKVLKSMALKP